MKRRRENKRTRSSGNNVWSKKDDDEFTLSDGDSVFIMPTNRVTRKSTAKTRAEQQRKEKEAEKEQKDQALADEEQERKNRPQAAPGNRGDNQFHIAFIDVGLGDSTILTTPKGTTVLIDCGCDGRSKNNKGAYIETAEKFRRRIHDTIYGPKFLGGENKKIDILVLTHSDQDHWNLLIPVKNSLAILDTKTDIGICYHSGDIGVYGKTRSALIENHGCDLFQAVTLDEAGYALINGQPAPLETRKTKTNVIADQRGDIKILDEGNCKIFILASNVYKEGAKGEHDFQNVKLTLNNSAPNRGSLVILIEVFDKKILICGDATVATEEFMLIEHAPWIDSIDVLRVAHHGSDSSSSLSFIEHLSPKKCVVSAGRNIVRHALPKYAIVKRYLKVLPRPVATAPEHFIGGWEGPGNNSFSIDPTSKELYITGINGTQEITYPAPTVTTTPTVTSKSKN